MQTLVILNNFLISDVYLSRWNIETSYYFSIKNNMSCNAFPFKISSELPLHNLGVKFLWIGDEKEEEGYGHYSPNILTTTTFSLYIPLDVCYGKGRKTISDIYGYPAFSEVSLTAVFSGFGFSLLIPLQVQGNFYFEVAGQCELGIGPYDLRLGVIRDGKEVTLYEGKQQYSGPDYLDGTVAFGYKSPFGIILLSTGVQSCRMPFPIIYNVPTTNDNSSILGLKIGVKIRRYLGAQRYNGSCCVF